MTFSETLGGWSYTYWTGRSGPCPTPRHFVNVRGWRRRRRVEEHTMSPSNILNREDKKIVCTNKFYMTKQIFRYVLLCFL